jgi:hypothetical protein
MNLNTILDIILNQRLGVVEYGLDDLYPEIHKNLLTNTLPIFSQYFPCYRRYKFNPLDHKTETRDEFYLKLPEIDENGLKVISVAMVVPQSTVIDTSYYDGYRPVNLSIEDVIMNSMATNTASLAKYSYRRFKFIPPNRISLRGFGVQNLSVTLKISYPSFSAIPDSVIEQFLDLGSEDIKIFLYNKLKHYEQLQLPVGNIDLKLDALSTGIDGRSAVIDRFNSKGYPNKSLSNLYRYE